jgi:hypothetical protein
MATGIRCYSRGCSKLGGFPYPQTSWIGAQKIVNQLMQIAVAPYALALAIIWMSVVLQLADHFDARRRRKLETRRERDRMAQRQEPRF